MTFFFENWLKYFDADQIHVVDGDTLVKNPLSEFKKIETFLQIRPFFDTDVFVFNVTKGFYCLQIPREEDVESEMECLYEGKGRKHPNVSEEVIREMQKIYRPHNQRFYKLSGKHFDWDTTT